MGRFRIAWAPGSAGAAAGQAIAIRSPEVHPPARGIAVSVALVTHSHCILHEMGAHHPESPERLKAVLDALDISGFGGQLVEIEAPEATQAELARVHGEEYIEMVRGAAPEDDYAFLDPDTSMNRMSLSAALRAAGAVARATDLVLGGEHLRAFCAVRPPGHHATPGRAMGFCIFNNVAVGVARALVHHGLERVAILDFDVHHGNGTEAAFKGDPRVMFCSTFQHPYYPFCGADSRGENLVNVPLPAMTGSADFREAVERHWLPALERFEPQLVMVSAGFDAHREDPLAHLELEDGDYEWITRVIADVAERHARGRIVSTLEGGYNTRALARSVVRHMRVLAG
ncbi:MAG: histone deacetylase family protein [Betaproteobacteria bacterium]|nr:histone deacetylase family protein [Betaproteobacteria bacterium]